MTRANRLILVIIVCSLILIYISYSNTLTVPFQFDDYPSIVDNESIRDTSDFVQVFDFQPTRVVVMYSFALNYALAKLNVEGYHILNILIHFLATLGVIWLVFLLFRMQAYLQRASKEEEPSVRSHLLPYFAAALCGFLFASHPIQTEAVTYIWQRNTSLSAFFYLMSICCYLNFRVNVENRRHKFNTLFYMASILFSLLGMFTKEICFTIPIMIVLIELIYFQRITSIDGKKRVLFCLPIMGTIVIIPLTTIFAGNLQLEHVRSLENVNTPVDYFLTQLTILPLYLKLILWPEHLSIAHGIERVATAASVKVIVSFLTVVFAFFVAIKMRKRNLFLSLGIIWFFVSASVESSFVPLEDLFFEHRMYLPLVGICLLITGLLLMIPGRFLSKIIRKFSPIVTLLIFMLLFLPLSGVTYNQNQIWQTKEDLWLNAVKQAPQDVRANTNLANAYMKKGLYKKAVRHYRVAIKTKPDSVTNRWHLGSALVYAGEFDLAKKQFCYLSRELGSPILGTYGMGLMNLKSGNLSRAEGELTMALDLMNHADKQEDVEGIRTKVLFSMSELYEKQNRLELAEKTIINYCSKNKTVLCGVRLARIYKKLRKWDEAIVWYQKLLEKFPESKEINGKIDKIKLLRDKNGR